ncbi:hypothetical protein SprV_0100401500 [Sparganum proliferum]
MQKSRSVFLIQVPSNELLNKPISSSKLRNGHRVPTSTLNLPDSGIDSLKMNSTSETADRLRNSEPFEFNLQPSHAPPNKRPTSMLISNEQGFIEGSLHKNGKISPYDELVSDYIPTRESPRRHEFRSPAHFMDFSKSLIEGLRLYVEKYEKRMPFYADTSSLHSRINVLKKKLRMVTKLLEEYQAILGPDYVEIASSRHVPIYQPSQKPLSRFASFLSLIKGSGQGRKFGSHGFLPETSSSNSSIAKCATKDPQLSAQHPQADRLCKIEEQVGRLSGCFQLCADPAIGSTLGLSSKSYLVHIRLQPLGSEQSLGRSLTGAVAGRRDSVLEYPEGSSPSPTVNSTAFCWSFKFSANQAGFYASTSMLNAAVTGYVPPNATYALSETTHNLSPEPFTALVATVFAEKGRKLELVYSETMAVGSLFSPHNMPLKISFSVLGMPFVNVHIFWLPLTTMDLEECHGSQSLRSDQLSSLDGSQRSAGRFYRVLDDQSDINSLSSHKSRASNQDYNQTVSSTSFASSLETGEYCDVRLMSADSGSKFDEKGEEEQADGQPMTYQGVSSAESSENGKDSLQSDASALGHIVDQLRDKLEYLTRTPCRYTHVLLALSESLDRLCEFTLSEEEEEENRQIAVGHLPPTTQPETQSDKAFEDSSQDRDEALCMLDMVVQSPQADNNSTFREFPPPPPPPPLRSPLSQPFSSAIIASSLTRVPAQPSISSCNSCGGSAVALRAPMTSGWTELDGVIRWHLQNIRYLLNVLSPSCENLGMPNGSYGGAAAADGLPHGTLKISENVLPVHQDLAAMALQDQADIVVALAGVVNYHAETQNYYQTVLKTNCLDYGGTRNNSLLPKDFWRLVWAYEDESVSRGYDAAYRLSACSTHPAVSLLISREKLLEYFFSLCRETYKFSDEEHVLQAAIEDLLDQVTDADITENSWNYIPLTQICLRLKPSALMASALKPSGIPTSVGRSPALRPGSTQRQELALYTTLRYIRSQARLQRQLRQHDEEVVYQTLEKFLTEARGNKRRQFGNISVNTFICVALNLNNTDLSLKSLAADVIRELAQIASEFHVIDGGNASMPFLRVAGPCRVFAKVLNAFTHKLSTGQFPRERESRADVWRRNWRLLPTPAFNPSRIASGCAFSPISSTLLWGIQSRAEEEYRMASLAAYSVIFGSPGGDGDTNPRQQQQQQRGLGRPLETAMMQRAADTVSLHSAVHQLSVEDESPRVRSLALEAIKTQRSNLGMSRAKFRSTTSIITEH